MPLGWGGSLYLSGRPPAISGFTPASGPVGTVVPIDGTALTSASSVTFNSTAATTFNVVSSTQVNATVTTGTAKVPGPGGGSITAQDEDILRFTPTNTGATTTGTWSLYWNPTSITGLSAEDINGYWEDPATGSRYVTIVGAFNIGNVAYGGKFAGDGKTILRFAPNAAAPGGWAPAEKLTWLATGATFPSTLDGIEMAR